MKINLKGKEYQLNFGIGFIHAMDQIYNTEVGGIEYGTGVNTIYIKLQGTNPYDIFLAIQAALKNEYDFTEEDFDEWVESFKSDKEYVGFIKELSKTLETQRSTGNLIKAYKQGMKQIEKELQKNEETANENIEK